MPLPRKLSETQPEGNTISEEIKQISASQMSYDNRLDNFDKLIKLLTSITLYAPNEADLKVTVLTTLYNDLKAKNTAVINAATPLSNVRIARNDVLYKDITGMVSIANDVKAYIKSLFGATSPQYNQISSLKYTTPRKFFKYTYLICKTIKALCKNMTGIYK